MRLQRADQKNAFFSRLHNPLVADSQLVTGQNSVDARRRVAAGEEKPDKITSLEMERSAFNFNPTCVTEVKAGHHLFQPKPAIFNRKLQTTVSSFDAEIEQERYQPVTRQRVVVLWQNPFHALGVIGTGSQIGAEEQKVFLPN